MRNKIFFLVLSVVFLAGCQNLPFMSPAADNQTPRPSPSPRVTFKPVAVSPAPAFLATPRVGGEPGDGTLTQPGSSQEALVAQAIDGETIEIAGGIRVRYLGMDAPESSQSGKIEECFGYEAHKKNHQLVVGKVVRLEKDFSETDGQGRLLRYVWVENILVNELLVSQGYARAESQRPDFKYQQRFLQVQTKAEENELGFWGSCEFFGQPRKKCGCDRDYQ